jgi:CBS domain-containing protein
MPPDAAAALGAARARQRVIMPPDTPARPLRGIVTVAGEIAMRARTVLARHLATGDVATVGRDMPLVECARVMRNQHVGSLIVVDQSVDGPRPVGIITDRDIVVEAVAVDLDTKAMTAGDLMSTALVTVRQNEDIVSALARMREAGVRRLPVIDEHGRLTGILAVDNLLEAVNEQLDALVGVIKAEQTREAHQRR